MPESIDELLAHISFAPDDHPVRLRLAQALIDDARPGEAAEQYFVAFRAGALPAELRTAAISSAVHGRRTDIAEAIRAGMPAAVDVPHAFNRAATPVDERAVADSSLTPPTFEPRLRHAGARPAPFNPTSYLYVAFFGGFVALAYVAVANIRRLPASAGLEQRTMLAAVATVVAGFAVFALAPPTWFVPMSGVRLAARVVAVVGAVGLRVLHRGPAFAASQRAGYQSMWKAIGPIIGAAVVQGLVGLVIAITRGVV